ncbi:MAG: dihydroneopterin aldolase [Rhodocyclaceae bacterium]|nr:dihydroneopterin aldolase [Rhodocyclaceae bacterium]
MRQHAWVELFDLKLQTQIGTYGPNDVRPESHSLDLILGIDASQVLIQEDSMRHVFDYDPLVLEIEKLAADGHYETQERLMTRIAQACVTYPEVKTINIKLSKTPVRNGSGALGVRLLLDDVATSKLRGPIDGS